MFILTKISDLVTIQADDFNRKTREVVEEKLHLKYANKVIPNIGLAICVWDITDASEGVISRGDGAANVNVVFRLVIFRPFRGEILVGQIASAGEWGIRVTLQFFDEIIVTPKLLFEGSKWDREQKVWIWDNDGENFYFDKHDWVRLRVEEEDWQEITPQAPSSSSSAAPAATSMHEANDQADDRKAPYRIKASMAQAGLGVVGWW